ncbi:MAG: carbonic anhydrase, partial [Leifsonia sp.]
MSMPRPSRVWDAMLRGNARFVGGDPEHPRQDVE